MLTNIIQHAIRPAYTLLGFSMRIVGALAVYKVDHEELDDETITRNQE